jgi:hypothetical protein
MTFHLKYFKLRVPCFLNTAYVMLRSFGGRRWDRSTDRQKRRGHYAFVSCTFPNYTQNNEGRRGCRKTFKIRGV